MDKLANVLAEQFNCTAEYAKQHMPELMHDYCMYHGFANLIGSVLSIIVLIACVISAIVIIESYKKTKRTGDDTLLFNYYGESTELGLGLIILTPFIGVCTLISSIGFTVRTIQAFCFPDVYILEKVLEVL